MSPIVGRGIAGNFYERGEMGTVPGVARIFIQCNKRFWRVKSAEKPLLLLIITARVEHLDLSKISQTVDHPCGVSYEINIKIQLTLDFPVPVKIVSTRFHFM